MSEIEVVDDSELQAKCFKCTESLHGCLNIVQNDSERTFLLWNKYQIFLYEDLNFDSVSKVFTPEFQINQIVVSNNYLVCIDCSGNVHTTSLKFKNTGQKRFKNSFQPRDQGILYCKKFSSEATVSLKSQAETYFLCFHKINSEFQIEKEICLEIEDNDWPVRNCDQEKCFLTFHSLSKEEFGYLSSNFNVSIWRNQSLMLISFDKLTVYACLISQKGPDDVISLKKLYTSPSEICDCTVLDKDGLHVLIGLTSGTIIRIQLKNSSTKPAIVHLNAALAKFITIKDIIIYTDGLSMWQAENIHSNDDINFKQFFVRDIKDFVKYNDQIICTTFTNTIYTFSIENECSFLKPVQDFYCPAETLLNNSEYLFKIKEAIDKNKEVLDKINKEGNHLTAVALSRRQDVMEKIIKETLTVYENYEEVIKDYSEVTLTEELKEYFKPELVLILIQITASTIQHSLSNMLSDILGNLNIHITLSTKDKLLKTTTVKLSEPLKKLHLLIPLQRKNIRRLNIELQFVTEIPGVFDKNETTWTILYRKCTTLNAEYFIKSSSVTTKNKSLKTPKSCIEDLICKMAEIQHGNLFQITDSKSAINGNILPFYVKLPHNFQDLFKDENIFNNHCHHQKANYIQNKLIAEDFLRSKSNVFFEIDNDKVTLELLNDEFSNPLLKISCGDMNVSSDLRNFFANVIYDGYRNSPREEFVSNALYTTTENLQKALKTSSSEDCLMLAERLQKNIIGALPL